VLAVAKRFRQRYEANGVAGVAGRFFEYTQDEDVGILGSGVGFCKGLEDDQKGQRPG